MRTLWKQDTALHPTFAKLNRCLEEDWFLLPHELKLQGAHAQALGVAGILSADEVAAIRSALQTIAQRYGSAPCPESAAEDIHTWIEEELTALAGEAGKKIHTGRSRNDQVATLLKMYVLTTGERIEQQLCRISEAFCHKAKEWANLVFPLQTHAQFAAPGSVGFWALRYAVAFQRMRARMASNLLYWGRYCPLGAGAVAGSSIPIDRELQAHQLGFLEPSRNALDATTTRDECIDLLSAAAQIGLHMQSFATDIIGFAQTPFGWVKYPAGFGTGSSMMPNKVNPDAMELLRGDASAMLAAHHHALLLLKGLPSGYNRDLQCLKPVVHHTATRLEELCALLAAFLDALAFDEGRMAEALKLGNIDATLRMEQMVREGQPLREAHHAVAASLHERRADEPPHGADAYCTTGSASPAETLRMADEVLASLRT